MCRSNPWEDSDCKSVDCPICLNGQGESKQLGKCRTEGICCRITCKNCEHEGIKSTYIGESSRYAFNRIKEHKKSHLNQNKNSPLWKHSELAHNGTHQEYKYNVISKHRTPLDRQITEWITIVFESKISKIMNSKNEWSREALPRIQKGRQRYR